MNKNYERNKRIFDIFFSLSVLLLLSPAFIVLYFVIRWKMGAPVLYVHKRAGLNGKAFMLYKFRTMTDAKNKDGVLLSDAERLTPFGQMLRKYSIDELPQFWNVLVGDMSVVGPRPLLPEYIPLYNDVQRKRITVKPGITGWAQINGRNSISWTQKFELDAWYVENRNFTLDWKIIKLTVSKVLNSDGISAENDATMPKFTGND